MRRIEQHLDSFVGPEPDALVFTARVAGRCSGGRSRGRSGGRRSIAAGLHGFTFHGLRHSFVAILVAAGCNVREVSEWAGHNSVAFTLTRYGGLFEDGSDEAVDRLDALLLAIRRTLRRRTAAELRARVSPMCPRRQHDRPAVTRDQEHCLVRGTFSWYPQRDSNPRCRLERAVS